MIEYANIFLDFLKYIQHAKGGGDGVVISTHLQYVFQGCRNLRTPRTSPPRAQVDGGN